MDKNGINDIEKSQLKFIEALCREASIEILLELCKDGDLAKRIYEMSKAALAEVEADVIADEVFRSLNSIQVEDLWDDSGKTHDGYQDPTDVAFKMIEDEVWRYTRKMEQYNSLGMKMEEKECCKGIIIGLLRYGESGNNEFRDWCPDDPYTVAENIIYDWKNNHTAGEIEEIQEVYDSFFADDETD
ncbi:MAG: hypothetical protein FWF88_04405 [Peptococcaceae bacterium]|nr:hypothetical protein [Peptococcaceae bacterium]